MPRQSRGRSSAPAPSRAPTRPTAAPARPAAPQQQQTRPASTAAYPPQQHAQQPPAAVPQTQQASQGPGLFGQMASTAAGVAVGSSIGHAVGGMFGGWGGGSSSEAPAQQEQQQQQPTNAYSQPMDSSLYGSASQSAGGYGAEAGPCAGDIKSFTNCMTENNGNMGICGWYLEQLKACQRAAGQY